MDGLRVVVEIKLHANITGALDLKIDHLLRSMDSRVDSPGSVLVGCKYGEELVDQTRRHLKTQPFSFQLRRREPHFLDDGQLDLLIRFDKDTGSWHLGQNEVRLLPWRKLLDESHAVNTGLPQNLPRKIERVTGSIEQSMREIKSARFSRSISMR